MNLKHTNNQNTNKLYKVHSQNFSYHDFDSSGNMWGNLNVIDVMYQYSYLIMYEKLPLVYESHMMLSYMKFDPTFGCVLHIFLMQTRQEYSR